MGVGKNQLVHPWALEFTFYLVGWMQEPVGSFSGQPPDCGLSYAVTRWHDQKPEAPSQVSWGPGHW